MNVLEFIISTFKFFIRGGLEYPLKDLKHYQNASKLTQFVTNFEWKRRKQPCKKKFSQIMRTLLDITYHSIDWSTQCSIYLSSFFVSVKLVLCVIKVSRSLHSIYSCSSWNFDRMNLGLGTGMPNPKWFHFILCYSGKFLIS